ncbi:hypothetical protein TBK1r_16820 [Stieleria magnilauensis]|uniref:Uncharacterized protein n=1 Tax=Stieleria magnilauensis TaxID=2527963 RepID=A0ABX5XP56_9BACT|nr:hypothetical protein TBK1r_16820 [Planctomycetes bacterium TBK1r]
MESTRLRLYPNPPATGALSATRFSHKIDDSELGAENGAGCNLRNDDTMTWPADGGANPRMTAGKKSVGARCHRWDWFRTLVR